MTDNIFKYIDVERTIAEFGYDPRELKKASEKFVIGICPDCEERRSIRFFSVKVSTCCRKCTYARLHYSHNEVTETDLQNVDLKATITKFGYDPFRLRRTSNKKVVHKCESCGLLKDKKLSEAIKVKKCLKCSNAEIVSILKANSQSIEEKKQKQKEYREKNKEIIKEQKRVKYLEKKASEPKKEKICRWCNETHYRPRNNCCSDECTKAHRKDYEKKHWDSYYENNKTRLQAERRNYSSKFYHENKEFCLEGMRKRARQAAMNRAISKVQITTLQEI